MSVNKYKPHLYILPEDGHNRELANGFIGSGWVGELNIRQVQVLPEAGGWPSVLAKFKDEYIPLLKAYEFGFVVLLIDFDEEYEARRTLFSTEIPDEFTERVFVIGVLDEPQDLRKALDLKLNFEEIGSALADDCHHNTTKMWDHEHLKHNDAERLRMMKTVKPILFN